MSNTNSGEYRICCESFGFGPNIQTDSAEAVWNSEFYKTLRRDMLEDRQNPNCNYCWKIEGNGGYSMRKNENKNYSNDAVSEILKYVTSDGALSAPPKVFDFKIGNLCNLKCITCCQVSSSMHETEAKQWKSKNIKLPKLIEWLDVEFSGQSHQYDISDENCNLIFKNLEPMFKNLNKIRLVGGEPLINPLTIKIIDRLVDLGYASDLELEIITNLSVMNTKLISKLEKFRSVYLTCSYDHIDPDKFHFIRFPADYVTFKNNFDQVLTNDIIKTEISTTFGIFNIFDIKEILFKFELYSQQRKSKLPISFNFIMQPSYFSIKYLTTEQKLQILVTVDTLIKENSNFKIFKENPGLVNYLKEIDKVLFDNSDNLLNITQERTRALELYDVTRNTDYKKLFNFL